jgi:phosphotriesterase-related protein
LLVDFGFLLEEPDEVSKKWLVEAPVSLENLAMLGQDYRNSSKDNLRLDDVNVSISELKPFRIYGGKSLVDVTAIGMGRDPAGLKQISQETGVNVVCTTGWYRAMSHPDYIKEKSIDQLSAVIVKELTEGIDALNIKAGVIKAGCDYPLHSDEEKVLRAAARAQRKTNAPLTIHPGSHYCEGKFVDSLKPILDIITEEEANLEKIYISHMDRFLFGEKGWTLRLDYHKSIMDEYPVTLDFDTFGWNDYYVFPALHRSDVKRVAAVAELCKQGYEKKIMLSQDRCYKTNLRKYGGCGYAHILHYMVPELRYQDVTEKQIRTMLIENPKRILSY